MDRLAAARLRSRRRTRHRRTRIEQRVPLLWVAAAAQRLPLRLILCLLTAARRIRAQVPARQRVVRSGLWLFAPALARAAAAGVGIGSAATSPHPCTPAGWRCGRG